MASELIDPLAPSAALLAIAVVVDVAAGDPVYPWHPVRLTGRLLTALENRLRATGADGYFGGILLFVVLSVSAVAVTLALVTVANRLWVGIGLAVHVFLIYSFLALGDLIHHVWRIERAVRSGDLDGARRAVRFLVGRDTDRMDAAACRRAAVESLSENLTDGYVSPICWYVIGGLAGLVVFKVVSTMDSMVGYKTPKYLRFGWCGARLDDAMNYVPARLTFLVVTAVATLLPGFSGRKAWSVGLHQHAILLGPNAGWSEAATAGAIQRRIVGPIWLNGALVTDQWIGEPSDPVLGGAQDVTRAIMLSVLVGLVVAVAAVTLIAVV